MWTKVGVECAGVSPDLVDSELLASCDPGQLLSIRRQFPRSDTSAWCLTIHVRLEETVDNRLVLRYDSHFLASCRDEWAKMGDEWAASHSQPVSFVPRTTGCPDLKPSLLALQTNSCWLIRAVPNVAVALFPIHCFCRIQKIGLQFNQILRKLCQPA